MRQKIGEILEAVGLGDSEIFIPEHETQGHYSTNAPLRLAKRAGKNPLDLARELADKIRKAAPADFFEKIEVAPPGFINFWLTPQAQQEEFARVCEDLADYGASQAGKGKTVIVEYSQPNIAKKMHVGHLRTTVVGDALANILEFLGYKIIRWNYLGDWGTQFGKLIAAYKLWGDKKRVEADPVEELQKLYVRFHDELKNDPELDRRGREEFRKLEEGDKENRELWGWFKKESLKEFKKTYNKLGVEFDEWKGESFFEEDIKPLVARLLKDGIAEKSEGAVVIRLAYPAAPSREATPTLATALIRKSDGASLYLTRDIAALEYRAKKYKPEKILYVVGNEQSLHFEQLFAVAKVMKSAENVELKHVKYGLVLGEGGRKLATREGRTILLEDALDKSIKLAREVVGIKNADLPEREKGEVADAVGVGALKYVILKENRNTDIVFDWKAMLNLGGDSAPYLQYAYARLRSIARKAGLADASRGGQTANRRSQSKTDLSGLNGEAELRLMRKIFEFPEEVARSGETMETSNLALYLHKLAALASRFYETTPVLKEPDDARRAALLALTRAASSVLGKGLGLLGIGTPEEI